MKLYSTALAVAIALCAAHSTLAHHIILTRDASVATSTDGNISIAESRAFQVGYQLEIPGARAEIFIHNVERLQEVDQEPQIAGRIGDLDSDAARLRSVEASSYNRALTLAETAGAPSDLKSWLQSCVDLLEKPVVISDDAKGYLTTEPQTARILSTLDEATALRAQTVDKDMSIVTWLKLSYGNSSLWARQVGMLTARIYISLELQDGLHHPTPTAAELVAKAPGDAPLSVLRALRALEPPVTQIGPLDAMIINPVVVQASYNCITSAFMGRQLGDPAELPAIPTATSTAG